MWKIDKHRVERKKNPDGSIEETNDLVETLEFSQWNEANIYYRNNRISYGAGSVYYTLGPIYE